LLARHIGRDANALLLIPLLVAALAYGLRGGLVALPLLLAGTWGMFYLRGLDVPTPNPGGVLAAAMAAVVVGHTRDLSLRLRESQVVLERAVRERTAELREVIAHAVAADRMALVGTLAGGIAHEVNNPLAVVISTLGVLEQRLTGRFDADLDQLLADTSTAAHRMRDIVWDTKVLSRPGAGATRVARPVQVVESALRLVAADLRRRAVLDCRLEPVPPVAAAESELGQVVLNLLVNALQALPERDPSDNRITVATRREGDRVDIDIGDNGIGIAPEIEARIFDPFFTTKAPGTGTGLGLWICHNIVTAAGGTVSLTTRPGEGARFRVSLPIAAAAEAVAALPAAAAAAPAADVPPSRRRGRILAVDDDALVARTLARLLAGQHEVTTVGGGAAALDLLARDPAFDLILCDLMMPEMNGMQLYRLVADRWADLARRFVFISGGALGQEIAGFLDTVDHPRMAKPFEPAALQALVARCLDELG
ncbi:MAG TPA: ATP-binding protein, partial [Kofleriaceae bacterium]|nr:ATP-binding protein [Kofleriaceae bacterium]